MRVLLADDHGLFLEGLRNLLQAGGYEVVGAAYDGKEALALARVLQPDVILMDVRMPNCNGLQAVRSIKAELPDIKIVMLTTSAEEEDLYEAVRSGASGYLLKNLKPDVLFNYLAGLARGEAPLSRELAGFLFQEFFQQAAPKKSQPEGPKTGPEPGKTFQSHDDQQSPELTARQREILTMVCQGLSYKEIGAALHVSENTVKYHMGEILQRFHLKNREQTVAYVLRHGLIGDTTERE